MTSVSMKSFVFTKVCSPQAPPPPRQNSHSTGNLCLRKRSNLLQGDIAANKRARFSDTNNSWPREEQVAFANLGNMEQPGADYLVNDAIVQSNGNDLRQMTERSATTATLASGRACASEVDARHANLQPQDPTSRLFINSTDVESDEWAQFSLQGSNNLDDCQNVLSNQQEYSTVHDGCSANRSLSWSDGGQAGEQFVGVFLPWMNSLDFSVFGPVTDFSPAFYSEGDAPQYLIAGDPCNPISTSV